MSNRPNIVLVVLDSVRAQNCSVHGYRRRTTPFLEELAEQAVVYSNAISTTVSTVPAHASIFTGTHVSTHELFVDGDTLSPDLTTLAECLSASGYRTFGVCYQDDVSPSTGLHRGFEGFEMDDEPGPLRRLVRGAVAKKPATSPSAPKPATPAAGASAAGKDTRRSKKSELYRRLMWHGTRFIDQGASVTQTKAERFLDSLGPSDRFFMYLHYDEAHLPYRPPTPYRHLFLDRRQRRTAATVNQDRTAYYTGEAPMGAEDFAVLTGLYDGAIAFLDARMRDLYTMLKRRGVLDDTILIIMGDHGDSIGEHGLMSHKFGVYDTLTRVLLLVRYPKGSGFAGVQHDEVVQHTDILPTVLDLAGLPESSVPQTLQGNSLVSGRIHHRRHPLALSELIKPFGREASSARGRMQQYDRRLFAIRSRDHKMIVASDGRHEIYDLGRDEHETRNLYAERDRPAAVGVLQAAADAHLPVFEACVNKYKDRI